MKGPGDTLSGPSGVLVEYEDEEYEPALALHRNVQMIAEAVLQMYEMQDLRRSWAEE
jgi:hypothetical protein